nr:hypothetical protein [Tanacetum cinerariifolium]
NDQAGANNDYETQGKHEWFDKHKLMGDDDDDISDLEDYMIQKDPFYYVDEEEKRSKERRCKGDDEEVIKVDELSNLKDGNLIEENKIAQIFRIDTDIFHFKTPLCEAFKEFKYLLKIDVDVLTNDILGFKTYDEYKDAWIYEWNKDVSWVADMPCGDVIYFGSYEYENLKEGELKDEALNSKAIFEGSKGVDEEPSDNARTYYSSNDEWEDFKRANHIGANVNSNCNLYLDDSRIFNDQAGANNDYETQGKHEWFNKHKLMGDDDDDISDLEDYMIQKDPLYYVDEEEKRSKERRCKLHE